MKWVARIIGVVVGLFGIAVGLVMIFGDAVLPDCDQTETRDTLREIVAGRVAVLPIEQAPKEEVMKAVEIADITESGFDKDKQIRTCKAVLSLKVKDKPVYDKLKIAYTIKWINQKERTFQVEATTE